MRCRPVILDSFTAWSGSHCRTGTMNGKNALKCQIWVLNPLIATTMDMGLWSASLHMLFNFFYSISSTFLKFLHLQSFILLWIFSLILHSSKTNLPKKLPSSIPHIDLFHGWSWIINHSKRLLIYSHFLIFGCFFLCIFCFIIFFLSNNG